MGSGPRFRHLAGLCLVAIAGLGLWQAEAGPLKRATAPSCPAAEGWRFVCGAQGAEDIVAVPGTRWLVASALNLGHPAPLSLIDGATKTAEPLAVTIAPRAQQASACPGPPDFARMSTDGLALLAGPGGVHRLYAANHGDRRGIEMFRLDARGARPTLAWTGCAIMPAHTLPNAVAALPDGGLLVVSFHDPGDAGAWQRMARGENSGEVLAWHPGSGFRTVPGSAMSGGNGIALSRDGRTAYVSAWSARRLIALPLHSGGRREIRLDFLPDNIHALPDGSLLVGGQRTAVASIARCAGPQCPQPWIVARIDPARGTVTPIAEGQGSALVNYACGALLANGTLYMTARGSGGLAYRPALPQTRHRPTG